MDQDAMWINMQHESWNIVSLFYQEFYAKNESLLGTQKGPIN